MDLKEVHRAVAKIQGQIFRRSNSYAVGVLKSSIRGAGIQYKEHKVYTHGDDIRFFDWKLSARTNTPFVKTFEEERNVEIDVVIDITPSFLLGHYKKSKIHAAIEILALLYLLSEKTGDKVKAVLWSDRELWLPARSGHEGIVALMAALRKIEIFNENGKLNRDKVLHLDCLAQEKKSKLLNYWCLRKRKQFT